MLTNIEGTIFDLDGTLVDSMWVWEEIDIKYLKNKNIDLPEDLRDHVSHLSFSDTAKYFKSRFNISDTLEQIQSEWTSMALKEYSTNVFLKPGAKLFLDTLKNSNIKIALATSNSTELLEVALKNNDIYHYFDSITTTNEVSRGKDFPDVYLLAAERINIHPHKCLVFEDILPAVKSAKSAGMKVVAVKDNASVHQHEELKLSAHMFINDFLELCE